MEYILIFIFGNLCKQHRVVAVPGYLSVPGRIQEGGNCDGYERCGCFRVDHRYHRHFPDSEVCTGCFRTGILADDYIYPGDCRIGADGGNHPEKGVSGSVSGVGCVLAADYNELLYSWCRYPGDSEDYDLLTGVVYAFSTAIGFGLALVLFAGLREQMSLVKIPKGMQGTPIALITAGLLAMAFMGFSGVV